MSKMIKKLRLFMLLGFLTVGVVLSGCVEDKAPIKTTETVPQSPTVAPATSTANHLKVIIEEADPSFEWPNKCEIQKNSGASGGSWLACPAEGKPPAPGAKINVTFTGTAVSVINTKAPFGGIIKVQIDGKTYPEIDTYSKDVAVQVKTEIASGLIDTNHILSFEITNKKNPLSGSPNESGVIAIDAIEITRQ